MPPILKIAATARNGACATFSLHQNLAFGTGRNDHARVLAELPDRMTDFASCPSYAIGSDARLDPGA